MSDSTLTKSENQSEQALYNDVSLDDFLPYLLNRITNRLNLDLLQDLRPQKINIARWRVLAVLKARDGRNIGELAVYTVLEQSTLSRVVDQMVRDGFVERRAAKHDNRVVRVFLTQKGREMFDEIMPLAARHRDAALNGFTDEEEEALIAMLHRILDNIRISSYS